MVDPRGRRNSPDGKGSCVADEEGPDRESIRREEFLALHEELGRLPAKYLEPIVLCYFEGLTHDEAASRLRWPVGTVSVRLRRARKILEERLTRRGLAPAAAAACAGVGDRGRGGREPWFPPRSPRPRSRPLVSGYRT